MLVEFSVGNYRSFRDRATLSLATTKTQGPEEGVRHVGGLSVSTVAAIYGANASGKSNLVNALGAARHFVLNSARQGQAKDPVPVVPFALDDQSGTRPSEFEFVFFHQGSRYRYGFRADRARVVEEWLYHRPTQRETNLFLRAGDSVSVRRSFHGGSGLAERTRPNALFLSVAAQFNSRTAMQLMEWFENTRVVHGIDDTYFSILAAERLRDADQRSTVVDFVSQWDPGVLGMDSERLPVRAEALPQFLSAEYRAQLTEAAVYTAVVKRAKRNAEGAIMGYANLSLDGDESEGLQKLFQLAVPIPDTLRFGLVLVVDELDARLHPLVTQALIRLFLDKRTNPNNAQLIFATHDTNLLNPRLLRRDQVWFTEKDNGGATHLYSLVEFMPRHNAQYERDYIEGRYGAIPFIGGLRGLTETQCGA